MGPRPIGVGSMVESDPDAAHLAGARVLVAEDEALIALDVEVCLRDFGCAVLGPTVSVADTLALMTRERPDAALLDARLLDGWATLAAEACAAQGVPFALVTGYGEEDLTGPAFTAVPRLI